MTTLEIQTAEVFAPLLQPARYKGAHGGRGSGKSHFFAEMLVEQCVRQPGVRAVCIREVQKSLKESAKKLIEDKIDAMGVGSLFKIQNEQIITPGDGVIVFMGMKDHTKESIKSLEGFNICWVEEAQTLSKGSLDMLRPTIRAEGSEIWFSWNPRLRSDPVDQFLRGDELPSEAVVVKANYDANPWFPDVLEIERNDAARTDPDTYDHIWEGDYITAMAGAYYVKDIRQARSEGRVGAFGADTLLPIRCFWDIGGTGAKADARAIWVAQFVNRSIRLLNYRETVGQPLSADVSWLRDRGYDTALMVLPHDGATNDRVYAVSYESALRDAGFAVEVIPNQGKGAAAKRIEAARRIFPICHFNHDTTNDAGLLALGFYHERIDEQRNVGLGPEHDWSSHCADAFGLMAVAYEKMISDQDRRPVAIDMVKRV